MLNRLLLIVLGYSLCVVSHAAEHPLTDKIYQVTSNQFVDLEQLKKTVQSRDIVMLGETHDNPRHHEIEQTVLYWLLQAGQTPKLVMEMLDNDQQAKINTLIQQQIVESTPLEQALTWNKRGWDNWPDYYPIFNTAISHGLTILAGNYPQSLIKKIAQQGESALPSEHPEFHKPLSEAALRTLRHDIQEAHCNLLPESALPKMLLIQQTRDQFLAAQTLQPPSKTLVIAGAEHIRTDRAIAHYLPDKPQQSSISIAMIEVKAEWLQVQDYQEVWQTEQLPFDYVWFTVYHERADQCEILKQHFAGKQNHSEPAPDAGQATPDAQPVQN